MDELVRWLGEQLDEDERIAREAGGAAWEELPVSGWVHTSALPDTEWQPPGYDHHVASAPLPADRAHIVAHAPARVLREIDAKRDLLRFAKGIHDHHETFTTGVAARLEKTLRLYGLAYADRPGYQESWRP